MVFNSSNDGSVDYSHNENNLVLNQDIRDEEKLIMEHSFESSQSDEKLRIKDLKYIKPPSMSQNKLNSEKNLVEKNLRTIAVENQVEALENSLQRIHFSN